jgi:cation-transporting ATPase 13A1
MSPNNIHSFIHSPQVLVSLIGQMFVHVSCLLAVLRLCEPHVVADAAEMAPDADFKPNVINTAVFYIGLCMHTSVFACNYQGLPYMQSLKDFKALHRILIGSYALMFVLVLELIPEVGEYLELVPAPTESFRYELAGYMLANSVFAMAWERAVRRMMLR